MLLANGPPTPPWHPQSVQSALLRVGRTCDLLPTERMWQRGQDVTSLIGVYRTVTLPGRLLLTRPAL